MFTLAVAAMGRKVKAVDAGFVNHAYIRYVHVFVLQTRHFVQNIIVSRASLNLSSTTENVDLIYNGLSDKYETLYPYIEDANNEGGLTLLSKEALGDKQVNI
jgi:hypothetical protein